MKNIPLTQRLNDWMERKKKKETKKIFQRTLFNPRNTDWTRDWMASNINKLQSVWSLDTRHRHEDGRYKVRKWGTKNGWRYREAIHLYRIPSCRYNVSRFNEQPDSDEQDVAGDNADVQSTTNTTFR